MKLFRISSTLVFITLLLLTPELYAQSLEITQIQPLNGTPSTSFTIYGSGFDATAADNTVTFTQVGGGSGTTTTVTGISGTTKLTATVPSGLTGGNYTINVERASDGTTADTPETFFVSTEGGFLSDGTKQHVSSREITNTIYAADLDGDGDLDLMTGSSEEDAIYWYENDGSQNFTEHMVGSTTFGSTSDVHAADVDRDGDLDLVVGYDTDTVAWFENDGSSTPSFTLNTVSTNMPFPEGVYAADVDGDGDIDIMAASRSSLDKISWYENDGNQNFTERVVSTNAVGTKDVYAADLDGDGDIDLMSTSSDDNKIAWYENDGAVDPGFAERVITTNAEGVNSVYAVDVNDDGHLDLMSSSSHPDHRIAWYENDGTSDPSFSLHTVSNDAFYARDVHAGDLNGDGDLDLIATAPSPDFHTANPKLVWYENDGNETFTEHIIDELEFDAVYAADMNKDGKLDVVTAGENGVGISWYENITPSSITKVQPLSGAPGNTIMVYGTNFSETAADNTVTFIPISGGSSTAATVTAASTSKLTVKIPTSLIGGNYRIKVDGTPVNPSEVISVITNRGTLGTKHTVSNTITAASSVYANDLDGDGDIDLMATSQTDDKIIWFENDGTQNFTKHEGSHSVNNPQSIHADDVDGDGDLDLVSASSDDNRVAWFENTGDSTPTRRTISTNANGAQDAYTADVNGDGNLDVIAALKNDDKIIWFENDGTQNFTEHGVSHPVTSPQSVYATDVDGDGDIDLMSASSGDNRIAWFENDGSSTPTLTRRTISTNASGARDVYAADLDGDGNPDMISASADDNKIAWYENNGGTTGDHFNDEQIVTSNASDAQSIKAHDVDGDGDLDLISASAGDNTIAWYENDGNADPSFTKHEVSTDATTAQSVNARDIDGDGDLDLISASAGDNTIAWYENDSSPKTFYVDEASGSDANDGKSWVQAFATLTKALSVATGKDQIWIAEGTYTPGPNRGDSFTITRLQDGLEIYGGFENSDTFADRSPGDHPVILSGDIGTVSDSTDNSYHVVVFNGDGGKITNETILDGVTITGGNADGSSPDNRGGAIYCIGGSGSECSPLIVNTVFVNNAAVAGGAIYNFGDGGNSSPQIIESVFVNNSASSGGAILNNGNNGGTSSPTITNATFTGNSASGDGGAIFNSAVGGGTSAPQVTNTILWENSADGSGNEVSNNEGTPTISYSLVKDSGGSSSWNTDLGTDGGNNLDTDPLFEDSADPDGTDNTFGTGDDGLTLQAPSPAIDAGKADTTGLGLPTNGIAGNLRILGTAVDMGAYEGPLTVQITGTEGWRMMTAPDDGLSYADLLGDLWLQGMTGGDVTNGTANLYTWDEASQQFQAVGDASTIPATGQGFIVYVYEDDDYETGGIQGSFPKTIPAGSARNSGTVSPALSYNDTGTPSVDGFNLVGNPYSSTIDWDAGGGWTKTNLDATFYVWSDSANSGSGAYLSWNGSTGTLPNGLIAPWQGFWVQANGASPALEFTENVQSTGGTFYKESEQQPVPQIQFKLTQSPPGSGVDSKELQSSAVVMFSEQAEAGKDSLDAWKLESLNRQRYLSLYTTDTERHALDINALPKELESPLELNLDFKGSDLAEKYTLSWNPQDLPDAWNEGSIRLMDLHTDRVLNLNKAGEYRFEVDGGKAKAKPSRVSETSEVSKPPKGSKRGRFEQRKTKSLDQTSAPDPPRHGPVPTVLKAKTTNPRFVLTINPKASGKGLGEIPEQTVLAQNYPNPFNPETVIRYGVPEQSDVQLNIYNVLGRKVRTLINEQKSPGRYQVSFNGSELASGLYFYRLKVASKVITKKMMLIK